MAHFKPTKTALTTNQRERQRERECEKKMAKGYVCKSDKTNQYPADSVRDD